MKNPSLLILILIILVHIAPTKTSADDLLNAAIPQVPTEGQVTMVDLGANKCIPCKMMAPSSRNLKRNTPAGPLLSLSMSGKIENRRNGSVFGRYRLKFSTTSLAGRSNGT